jgi:hypothetical protein
MAGSSLIAGVFSFLGFIKPHSSGFLPTSKTALSQAILFFS